MLLDAEESQLLLVDYQPRMLKALHQGEEALARAVLLAEVAQILGVPAWGTEQNPEGLGAMTPELQPLLQATFPNLHAAATRRMATHLAIHPENAPALLRGTHLDPVAAQQADEAHQAQLMHQRITTEEAAQKMQTSAQLAETRRQQDAVAQAYFGNHDNPLVAGLAKRGAPVATLLEVAQTAAEWEKTDKANEKEAREQAVGETTAADALKTIPRDHTGSVSQGKNGRWSATIGVAAPKSVPPSAIQKLLDERAREKDPARQAVLDAAIKKETALGPQSAPNINEVVGLQQVQGDPTLIEAFGDRVPQVIRDAAAKTKAGAAKTTPSAPVGPPVPPASARFHPSREGQIVFFGTTPYQIQNGRAEPLPENEAGP